MDYVIGIDGGGTKSHLMIADLEGKFRYETKGGPTNIHATGARQVRYELDRLIRRSLEESGYSSNHCRALCIGSAGMDRPDEQERVKSWFREMNLPGKLWVTNDAETVLAAGSGAREGVVVISGTGSIAYGYGENGGKTRAGGWGHILGDEGSGYDIAVRALRASVRTADGREPQTLLLPMLKEAVGIKEVDQLNEFIYSHTGKKEIAALAKTVYAAYLEGDAKAREILSDAAQELFLMAATVIRRLSFSNQEISLVTHGSVLDNMEFLYDRFISKIHAIFPLIHPKRMERNAAWGAVEIALDMLTSPKQA